MFCSCFIENIKLQILVNRAHGEEHAVDDDDDDDDDDDENYNHFFRFNIFLIHS